MTQDEERVIIDSIIPSKFDNRALREFIDSSKMYQDHQLKLVIPPKRLFHKSLAPAPVQQDKFQPPDSRNKKDLNNTAKNATETKLETMRGPQNEDSVVDYKSEYNNQPNDESLVYEKSTRPSRKTRIKDQIQINKSISDTNSIAESSVAPKRKKNQNSMVQGMNQLY